MTVLPYAKQALTLKRFIQIDNEQYNSHADPCTVYVKIVYHHHLNVSNPSIIMSSVKFINEII